MAALVMAGVAGLPGSPAWGLPARAVPLAPPSPESSYSLAQRAPFNRPAFYPLERRPDPALYRPHAEWMGRLILPAAAEATARPGDWVWLELEQAPPQGAAWIGRRLRLTWEDTPSMRALVRAVTTDIQLGPAAQQAARNGNVVPTRLDGRRRVGPLQSLAGAVGLEWVNSDAEKIRVVQEAMAREPKPIHVPREPRPVVVVDEGPLVLVETRKDLSQYKLPFEAAASPN